MAHSFNILHNGGVDKFKIIVSDCHLSAGRFYEGQLNPHEDFHYDEEMVNMFEYFSTGPYGIGSEGPVDVELILAGDFLDPLNVPIQGEFEDAITEDMALQKIEAIIKGHPRVMAALKRFASLPGKKITYLIGNHDADLFFEKVRERITREWDPAGQYPSEKVELIADKDRIYFEEGVEVRHGNQLESGNELNFHEPVIKSFRDTPVLNLPWSSFYVLKIVNRLKWEREWIDKVRPIKIFVIFGLIVDTWFTLRFCFLSSYYFIMTRFRMNPQRRSKLKTLRGILKQEARLFLDLEREAREILDRREDVKTIIFGHTHKPMNKIYADGKQYINTGTWTKMINLDFARMGQHLALTFAFVRLREGEARCELRTWQGEHSPHKLFSG